MASFDFDFFVIGGGSGGVRAARWAANKGLKVGIAEGAKLGGTCVNVGCVPKKLFFHAAEMSCSFKDAEGFGWSLGNKPLHDWSLLKSNIDKYLQRLNSIYGRMLDKVGVTRYHAWASFVDEHTVELSDHQGAKIHISAQYFLLAPGSKATFPEIEGKELACSSDDFFALKNPPNKAVVLGGGYIGVEMAGVLAGLGVDTTLVYRSDLPLRGFDQDIRLKLDQALRKKAESKNFTLRPNSLIRQLTGKTNGFTQVKLSTVDDQFQDLLEADFVLFATGRKPNISRLNLQAINVNVNHTNGAILVDEHYRTSLPHIYAVGDVIDRIQLTPVALAEAMRVVEHIVGGTMPPLDYDLVPSTVFSHPNVGSVGLSEQEALQRGQEIQVFEADFKPLSQALNTEPSRVYMKLIVNAKNDQIIGCHMVGDQAGEQIQGLAAAMQASITKSQLDQTVGIHPTMAEEWVTMRTPRAQ